MKKLLTGVMFSLFLLCGSVLTAQAAVQTIDFNSLPLGQIPMEGIDLGDVKLFGQMNNDIFNDDPKNRPNFIGVFPGTIIFQFASTLSVQSITATIGSNAAPATVQAFGTLGSATFSLDGDSQWDTPTTQSLAGIGIINMVWFSGYESYMAQLSYTAEPGSGQAPVPVPGALLLLGGGLVGLAGISRRKTA